MLTSLSEQVIGYASSNKIAAAQVGNNEKRQGQESLVMLLGSDGFPANWLVT